MKIDSHQHFWKFVPEEFDWIAPSELALRKDFLPPSLQPALTAAGFDGCVAVQARQTLAETQFLLDEARENPFIRGVVGWVPLADPAIQEILEVVTREKVLKGVRHVVQGETDPEFLERRDFNNGIRALTALGLTYDLLIVARQLTSTLAFVDRHPAQKFVVDHIAKPDFSGSPPSDWEKNMRALAEREQVFCKFSGIVTEIKSFADQARIRPYFDIVLDAFGAERVMFGTDWPVCLSRISCADWVGLVNECTSRLTPIEQGEFWGGSAAKFYRLS